MSQTKMPVRGNNYNSYFVNPELRYKKRTIDPKTVKENIQNEEFVYNTLRDDKFNNWQHPFEKERRVE